MDLEQKIKDEKNEYQREWRSRNKDKIKKYNQRYWERRVIKQQQLKEGK